MVDGGVGLDILGDGSALTDVPGGRIVFGYPKDGMPLKSTEDLLFKMTIQGIMSIALLDTMIQVTYVILTVREHYTNQLAP